MERVPGLIRLPSGFATGEDGCHKRPFAVGPSPARVPSSSGEFVITCNNRALDPSASALGSCQAVATRCHPATIGPSEGRLCLFRTACLQERDRARGSCFGPPRGTRRLRLWATTSVVSSRPLGHPCGPFLCGGWREKRISGVFPDLMHGFASLSDTAVCCVGPVAFQGWMSRSGVLGAALAHVPLRRAPKHASYDTHP